MGSNGGVNLTDPQPKKGWRFPKGPAQQRPCQ